MNKCMYRYVHVYVYVYVYLCLNLSLCLYLCYIFMYMSIVNGKAHSYQANDYSKLEVCELIHIFSLIFLYFIF